MTDDQQRLRERAYALWEAQGRPDGMAHAHWDQASQEIAREDEGRGAAHVQTRAVKRTKPKAAAPSQSATPDGSTPTAGKASGRKKSALASPTKKGGRVTNG
ncbi:DUF2934 domain-containing protein [Sphingomonas hengshuiensis]|uniref:DUF2934 domain-containing protein n=1 Tax=Sphingomonas hengshuiensis TaxID=1609977 RepID=UPI000981E754|nr:DUF2934 domain-containing protein [Sphingomonas hengshuiensis]